MQNQSDKNTEILLPSSFSGKLVVIREMGKGASVNGDVKMVSNKILCRDKHGGRRRVNVPQIHLLLTHSVPKFISQPLERASGGLPVWQQWGLSCFCDSRIRVVVTKLALPSVVAAGFLWTHVHLLAMGSYFSSPHQMLSSPLSAIYLRSYDKGLLWTFCKAHFPLNVCFLFIFPGYLP